MGAALCKLCARKHFPGSAALEGAAVDGTGAAVAVALPIAHATTPHIT